MTSVETVDLGWLLFCSALVLLAIDAGCDDFVAKPIDDERLVELVSRHLGTR